MNPDESVTPPEPQALAPLGSVAAPGPAAEPRTPAASRNLLWLTSLVALVALTMSGLLWQKLATIQEHLARQSADAGAHAIEARALARQAQELARDTAARQAVADTRLGEVALQRTQLEELMQTLSRSRDENLVIDIESAVRLAQQQAQLTGSVEPLLAALRTADQRIARAAQPRLARLRAAIGRDIDRIKATSVTDMPGLLARLDELVRQADDLPVANAVPLGGVSRPRKVEPAEALPQWWQRAMTLLRDEARNLVRVSRIEQPEAALLAPEQSFFLRENLKLKLLNARLGLLARQTESARADLAAAAASLNRYFDPAARKTQVAAGLLQQVQAQMKAVELPRIDETLAALSTASAGR
ncbi:MAG: uroporphyrinogen-III C-methyltransferase [Ramlibacter sp.]|nr:uroporphyrinogen-III C-methyltransferase [Ramlibacter sp.]